MKASQRQQLIVVSLLLFFCTGATCGSHQSGDLMPRDAASGSWKLVSSKSGEQVMAAPQWDGELHVIGDRYSRFYVRRSGIDDVPFASFSDAGSWYAQETGDVVLTVEFSSFANAVGNQYKDKVQFDKKGKRTRMSLAGKDFEEIWEMR